MSAPVWFYTLNAEWPESARTGHFGWEQVLVTCPETIAERIAAYLARGASTVTVEVIA